MKKVVITQPSEVVELSSILPQTPILIYKDGELLGMIIFDGNGIWHASQPTVYVDDFHDYSSRDRLCKDLIKAGYELKIDRKDD